MAINDLSSIDVEVGKSWKMNKRVRVPPETQMKKLKIKKIDVWEHNESIRKKSGSNNVVETEKKKWELEKKVRA